MPFGFQISQHLSDTRYRAWPRVKQFIQDLEPGSILCDVGKTNILQKCCQSINFLSVCLSVYSSVCLSIDPSVCLSVCLSACLPTCRPSVCLSFCLSINLSIFPFVHLSICPFVHLSVLSAFLPASCLSVCLYYV
jgi:hypothetical protein